VSRLVDSFANIPNSNKLAASTIPVYAPRLTTFLIRQSLPNLAISPPTFPTDHTETYIFPHGYIAGTKAPVIN
jgi:hypothetical protein